MSESSIRETDVVVVGGGFAGVRCATILAEAGVRVCILEENVHMGGQLLRSIPENLGRNRNADRDSVKRLGKDFLNQLRGLRVRMETDTAVFGIYPEREIAVEVGGDRIERIRYKYLVLATGARERFMPFPGWTLPGVMSAGMVQVMLKSSGIRPSERILMGGSGLFLLSAAYEFIRSGGKVVSVLEDTGMLEKIRMIPNVVRLPVKLVEGARYASSLLIHGVPYRFRTRIVAAEGSDFLKSVVTARTDQEGRVRAGTEKRRSVDTLAVGYGFIPNVELFQLAGCGLEYRREMGGWVARVDENMETDIPGVFAAGEPTGVAGALKSIVDGEIVAWRLLQIMERKPAATADRKLSRLRKRRAVHMRFGAAFNGLFSIPAEAYRDIPDETVICRCEDVRLGDIRGAIAEGYSTLADLKTAFRVTMGGCQGRTCGAMIEDILGAMTGNTPDKMGPISQRPPARPIRFSSFPDCAGKKKIWFSSI